jgi:VWFA-related protein
MKKVPADERIALYVISHNEGLIILQDYTTDHELIVGSLSKRIPRGVGPGPVGLDQPIPPSVIKAPSPAERDYLWRMNSEQARLSLQALAEYLAQTPGRKSVFWITQGFPPRFMKGSDEPAWNKTIAALNEGNVAVNTVDSRGVFRGANPAAGTLATVQQIAEATGGKSYFGRNDIDAAISEGIEASRTTYTLAFYLTEAERDNTFHSLNVRTSRPGVKILSRQGYYAGDTDVPGSSAMDGEKGELESALLNQVNSDSVGITVTLNVKPGDPQGAVDLAVTVDPHAVSLKEDDSGSHGRLQDMFLEMDQAGKTLGRIADNKDFDVTRADRASFENHGVRWPVSMPLMPGATKITILVRDRNSGHIGSLTIPLAEVH